MSDLYAVACDAIDREKENLNRISRDIWEHPEENFEEVHAHKVLTDYLEQHEFPVERSYLLNTGFRSVIGSSSNGPNVAVLCEYDALPEIGHACGHNLIAEVGVATAIGIKAAFEARGKPLGKLTVMGTPAEEGGGGKIDMINGGAFKDVDAAMMAHPSPWNMETFDALAIESVVVQYHGKAAHASAMPWQGVNALDAAVLCYQNVSCMRQQLKTTWRVHGIISKGGLKPNIIPELTELEFYARAPSKAELGQLKDKMTACFVSAGTATGCKVDINWKGRQYLNIIQNRPLSATYRHHAIACGVDYDNHGAAQYGSEIPAGSTDMGNVSYEVPSIHPMYYIGGNAINHSREFTEDSGSEKAQGYTLAVAKALARTAIDIYTQPELLKKIKEEFDKAPK